MFIAQMITCVRRRPHWFDALAVCAAVVFAAAGAGCDTSPLVAPINSTISLTASAQVVAPGGSAQLTATLF
jgi:hypothetical protein